MKLLDILKRSRTEDNPSYDELVKDGLYIEKENIPTHPRQNHSNSTKGDVFNRPLVDLMFPQPRSSHSFYAKVQRQNARTKQSNRIKRGGN